MPRRVADPGPKPQVMVWGKSSPEFAVAGVTDLVRGFFQMFWFFGPLVLGAGTGALVTGWLGWTGDTVSSTVGAAAGAAATAVGVYGDGALEVFGVLMAIGVGMFGSFAVFTMMALFNFRIFRRNLFAPFWIGGSIGLGMVPFLGALPALTVTTWRMYHTQIKKEKALLKKWEKEKQAFDEQQARDELFDIQQARAAQNAANTNAVQQDNNAENEEIHEEERKAA